MKKISSILNAGPAKWLGIYVILMSTSALIFSSFRPKSITDNSQVLEAAIVKKVINQQTLKQKENEKNKKDTNVKIDSLIEKINPIQKYLDKYNAVDFNNYNFSFTIDYQEKLKNKTVIFYILIQDIFEDNKHFFIKAAKSFFGMNIYLKIECDKPMIQKLKKAQFFTYAVVHIKDIDNIYFNAKSSTKEQNKDNAEITLSSSDKNLLISGKCLDIF